MLGLKKLFGVGEAGIEIDPDFIKKWSNPLYKHTPDWHLVQQKPDHFFFLYGNEQEGMKRNEILKDLSPIYEGFTDKKYEVYLKNLGSLSYPSAIIPKDGEKTSSRFSSKPAILRGTVYLVSPHHILELDKSNLNGVEFNRRRVAITIPYTKEIWCKDPALVEKLYNVKLHKSIWPFKTSVTTHMWMYVARRSFLEPLLDGGYNYSPLELKEPKRKGDKEYYHFTKNTLPK